ncbi:hypothetical protein DBR43_15680 [Pedobacter sp. KBW06]|uniref:hypothetical protein n=1 Tax=Pedobacter sp. KBW06 TaxID=2153359 RepID=UPI000F59EBCF|nr:hypothetical protein [Pedobacter sp. KBW06]RQO69516.1 hypothetical protein DBR43_15680 [Pedobacter sp. KBW06]
MKNLTVISEGQKPFQLIENNEVLAMLNYPKWYSTYTAEISGTKPESKLSLKVQGLCMNKLTLWDGDQCICQSKLNWDLSVTVHLGTQEYLLKMKRLTEGTLALTDADQNELICLKTNMNWQSCKASYEICINEKLNFRITPEQLLFIVHNCNYFMALSGNQGVSESLAAM